MTDDQARELFLTDLPLGEAAKQLRVRTQTLHDKWKSMFSPAEMKARRSRLHRKHKLGAANPSAGRTGEQAFHWKGGGPVPDGKGYVLVPKPDWFTGRPSSKYVFEHHVVYCGAHGLTEIPAGYDVHHRDGNKVNNVPENLELLLKPEHGRLHVPAGMKVGQQRRKFNDHPARE